MSSHQDQWVNHHNTLLQLASASANPPMIPRPESSQSHVNLSSSNSTAQLHHMLQHSLYPPPPAQLTHLHIGTPVNGLGVSSASNGMQFNQGYLPNPLPPINDHQLAGNQGGRQSSQQSSQPSQQQSGQQSNQQSGQQSQQQQQKIMRSITPLSVMSSNGLGSSMPNQLLHYQHMQDMQIPQQQQHQYMLQEPDSRSKKRKSDEQTQQGRSDSSGASKRTTHENILKLVALKNKDKPLSEYAAVVRNAEIQVLNMDVTTHAKSEIQSAEQHRERERQIYALIWLMNNCVTDTESYVPRGRIFAQYAATCAQNQLKPLSQATLGKLIRALFPYLKTRRLGMRGQSKYHYCGLKLVSQFTPLAELTPTGTSTSNTPTTVMSGSCPTSSSQSNTDNSISLKYEGDAQSNIDPQTDHNNAIKAIQSEEILGSSTAAEGTIGQLPSRMYLDVTEGMQGPDTAVKMGSSSDANLNVYYDEGYALLPDFFAVTCEAKVDLPIEFPNLQKYLPGNQSVDLDIASSVNSLYQVYCNTLFENIRFMKFDDLPSTLQSFSSSSISSQMYNLFISEELYSWVHESDLLTHKALTKMLSSLIVDFNEIPDVVLDKLSDFSNEYYNMVQQATMDLPLPMVTLKKNIALSFSHLVKRLVKVIHSSKSISNILNKQENRLSMLYVWEEYVKVPSLVNQEFSYLHYPSLEKEIEDLLTVQLSELFKKSDEDFNLISFVKATFQTLANKNVSSRLLVLTFNSLTTSCVKDISQHSVENFGYWWMFKTFLDEWVFWYAEVGGFLKE